MSNKLKDLREQRGKLVHDARALLDSAEAAGRELNADEDVKYKEIFAKVDGLRSAIEREERLVEAEREAAELKIEKDERSGKAKSSGEQARSKRDTDEYRAAYAKFLSQGEKSLTDGEIRALQSDSDTGGGYMVAAEQFVTQLIKGVDDLVFIRQKATKFALPTAASLGAPSLTADPADAEWTAEILTGSEDSAMAFGKRSLSPYHLAKRIKVSNKLIRQAAGAETLVSNRLAYKFAISQEKAFLTGSGSNQPLGVFTASDSGISTARDVSTGNNATAPTFDGLLSAKFSLKGAYWANSEWLFHRDVLAVVAKLKDGDGQYIWRASVRAGEPDSLLGRSVNMSEYAPNTMTSGLYVGILGDFSNYWIVDALDMNIQRLAELYAETNQVGFIGRMETDGMPVLEEAFARVKLG